MKFSEQWLREWVNPPLGTDALCAQLTMAGLEVDAVTPVAPSFEKVVIGEVLSVEPHPDADRLRVCQVEAGTGKPLNIVCGAANVHAGARVPTALIGARLPGGLNIKPAKLRGVPSEGMLCSEKELGLAESAQGLMLLPADAPVGSNIREYLQLDDYTIELGLTPNRGDCLSVAGIAREVGVLNGMTAAGPLGDEVAPAIDDQLPVTIDAPQDCPRYVGRVLRGVNGRAATPMWMVERLRRSGLRSLGPLIDVTNYVMLELGQPMHAFDLAKLAGGIRVRHAQAGERLTLLDGKEIALEAGTLLIADERGPLALAGVMGGEGSAVDEVTNDVFLESAFFAPMAIAGRARAYGLHTDSSHRFERGVDPQLQRRALERATALLLEIAGGQPGPVIERTVQDFLPARAAITLRTRRIAQLLGIDIPAEQVGDILVRLGMQVASVDGGWSVTPPSFRFDVAIEIDLIEEIGRVYGYSRLPSVSPQAPLRLAPESEAEIAAAQLRRLLVDRGYQEAITYSFVDPRLQALLDPQAEAIALANPISSDMAVMRTNLWPGLVQTLVHNVNRQQGRVRVFESGLKFNRQAIETTQQQTLTGLAYGATVSEQWGEASRDVDFFDVKADVEAVLRLSGRLGQMRFVPESHPALHPGQTARIYHEDQPIGWLGALSPAVMQALDVAGRAFVFELDQAWVQRRELPAFREISKFPAIRRDIAVVVDQAVAADALQACIRRAASGPLRDLVLFDMYSGKGIDSGKKSLAFALTLQDDSRTLTDVDVEAVMARVVAALDEQFGARLRD